MAIGIGCGSWADPEYAGLLYPRGFPPDLRLCGYAMWFEHVEVNATYYAVPKKEQITKWVEQTPASFRFDIRLHQAFSRSPVKAAQGSLFDAMLEGLEPLLKAKRLGTFLFVVSPFFKPEKNKLEELDGVIEKVRPYPLAIELRHCDWVDAKTRASTLHFFRERKVTWVAVDMPRIKGATLMPPVDEVTNPQLAYLRLHGRNPDYTKVKTAAERHVYVYSDKELGELTARVQGLARKAKDVRVVANNHAQDFAPKTALALKGLLGQPFTA